MNLLITPALQLTEEQKQILSKDNNMFFISSELEPVSSLNLSFSLNEIEGIICNHYFLVNSLSVLPRLKFIQLTSAGLDRVPIEEIQKKNIVLYNAGSIYAVPIAEWVICQILDVYKKSEYFFEKQKQHIWKKNRTLRELSGSTAVIIGYGNIGRAVAKRLKAFNVTVYAVDLFVPDEDKLFDEYYGLSKINDAISMSDIVVVCAPLTEVTYHMINATTLSCMREHALLINPSRGKLIDETALIDHIASHKDFFAVLDVFEHEPLCNDSILWNSNQVRISPHNAFVSPNNNQRLFELLLNNLSTFCKEINIPQFLD